MARKQVLIQLDDGLIARLDQQAQALGVSRSEVLRRACHNYLDDVEELRKEREMIEAYRRLPQDPGEFEPFHRLASQTVPPW